MQCQIMQPNRTQCQREAELRKPEDELGREIACKVCVAIMKNRTDAELYTVELTPEEIDRVTHNRLMSEQNK